MQFRCCKPGIRQQKPSHLNWFKVDGEGSSAVQPLTIGFLLRHSPLRRSLHAHSPPPPPPSPLLAYPFITDSQREAAAAAATLVTNQRLQWAHPFLFAASELPWLYCSYCCCCCLLAHTSTDTEPWKLSIAFLPSELSCTHFLPFSCFLGTFWSMFSLVCFSNLLWTLAEPARWIIFFLDS